MWIMFLYFKMNLRSLILQREVLLKVLKFRSKF